MGFKNFALCAFAVCMILPFSNLACVDVIQKPGIQCWSSCGLGNCGVVSSDPRAFVRCSWQLNQEGLARKFNETVSLYFPYNDGELSRTCEPTDHECNLESGDCIATLYQANCSYIGTRQAISAWFPKTLVSMCDARADIRICTHVKPDRPIVTGISFDEQKNQLLVSTSKETCPSSGLKYYLLYNWTRGNAIEHVIENMEPYMIYKEATLYNYSLQLTKTGDIYSESFHGTYITKPKTALDVKAAKLRCLHTGKGLLKNVKIIWKKYGIIDYFNVTLIDREDNSTVQTAIITATSTKQTHYSSTAVVKELSRDYVLLITAYNGGGASKTHRQEIRRIRCLRPPKISCRVARKGESWIEVVWEIDSPKLFNFELDFVSPHQTGDHLGSGKLILETRRSWNQTDLKSCVPYKISICADDELLCCKLTEFTKGPGPQVAPTLEDHVITSRIITIKLKHTRMKNSSACGRIDKILVTATSKERGIYITKEQSVSESHFKLQKLEPNTKYNISMAAVNDDGIVGVNRTFVLKTLEEAPDNPPGIHRSSKDSRGFLVVEWDPVESSKGQITHYHLQVNISEMAKVQDIEEKNCKLVDDGYFCTFPATKISAILNIKEAEQVSICACTANGTQCSPWSEPAQVVKSDSQVSLMLIILCFLCGVMLLMVATIGTIYRLKNQGPKPRKPLMHPTLQAEFEEELLKGTARKDSIEFEKKV